MNANEKLAEADVELMRRLQRINELEAENSDLRERVAALTAMLADADEKRDYWRQECIAVGENARSDEW